MPIRGRDELIGELAAQVEDSPDRTAVLHGSGGYGKSTVALMVSVAAAQAGRTVLWVSAHDRERFEAGMRAAALRAAPSPDAMDFDPQKPADSDWDPRKPADSVWTFLDNAGFDWILVLDNVDDLAVLAPQNGRQPATGNASGSDGPWLRRPGARGFVLITTRLGTAEAWQPYPRYLIDRLSAVAGASMIVDHLEDAGIAADRVEALADQLAGFPLALSMAGAYLGRAGADRITDFDAMIGEVDSGEAAERRVVGTGVETSLQLLEAEATVAARPLLRLAALLGPAPLPLESLSIEALSGSTLFAGSPVDLNAVVSELAALQLVESDRPMTGIAEAIEGCGGVDLPAGTGRRFFVHEVVREVCLAAPDYVSARREFAELGIRLVEAAIGELDPESSESWPRWREWAPHATRVLESARAVLSVQDPALQRAAELARSAAWYVHRTGDHKRAERQLEAIVELHVDPAGDREWTEPRLESLVAALREHAAPEAMRAVPALSDLGRVRRDGGDWPGALVLLKEVERIQRSELGPDADDTIRTRNRVGSLHRLAGDFPGAEKIFRELIELQERRLPGVTAGSAYEALLSTRFNLALVLRGKSEAEDLLTEVLAERVRLTGALAPKTLMTRNQLAVMLRDRGQLEEAMDQFQATLDGRETRLGRTHRDTLSTRNQLAGTLYRLGERDEAVKDWRFVLAERIPLLGLTHPYTLIVMQHLGKAELESGELDAAEQRLNELLELQYERYDGVDNDQTFGTRTLLSRIAFERGRYDEAIREFSTILAGMEERNGPDHSWTIETVFRRGIAYMEEGDLKNAEQDLGRTLQGRQGMKPGAPDRVAAEEKWAELQRRKRG